MKKWIRYIKKLFVSLLFIYIVVTGIVSWNRHWLILRPAQENTIFYDKNSQQYKNSEGMASVTLKIFDAAPINRISLWKVLFKRKFDCNSGKIYDKNLTVLVLWVPIAYTTKTEELDYKDRHTMYLYNKLCNKNNS